MSKELTIEEMQSIAEQRGGKCLSTFYVNCNTKLELDCFEGHVWPATANDVTGGTWCPPLLSTKQSIS